MRRTSPALLVVVAVLGGGVGFVFDSWLTGQGRSTFTPTVMLPILLLLLAATCLILAWPIRTALRRDDDGPDARPRGGRPPIDPFRALRVAMLAKSSSLVGAAVAGAGAGLIVFLFSRPVGPPLGSVTTIAATALSAVVLVAAALLAEHFCTLPKDPDEPATDEPGAERRP